VLAVEAPEGRAAEVQWSTDLTSWTPVWAGVGLGKGSPIRIEGQGLIPSEARFWRLRVPDR